MGTTSPYAASAEAAVHHRLVLIRHSTTAAVRAGAFPSDEPLDAPGAAAARAAARAWSEAEHRCGPARRVRETAELLGLQARVEPAIAEADFGSWRGRTLAEIDRERPDDVADWLAEPESAPHGGESLADVHSRVAAWMAQLAGRNGSTVAVTSGGVIKAAITIALGAPVRAAWQVDVSPLSETVLMAWDGRWSLRQANAALALPQPPTGGAPPSSIPSPTT